MNHTCPEWILNLMRLGITPKKLEAAHKRRLISGLAAYMEVSRDELEVLVRRWGITEKGAA